MHCLPDSPAAILFLQVLSACAADSIYDIPLKDIDGKDTTLKPYPGKVLLIVNVASKCGFTPQYTALEALYQKYKDQGLVVLGFPCNQFGGQEPGTDAEIKQFCTSKYSVTFPMFDKLEVNGANRHPLYVALAGAGLAVSRQHRLEFHQVPDRPRRQNPEPLRFAGETGFPGSDQAIEAALAAK